MAISPTNHLKLLLPQFMRKCSPCSGKLPNPQHGITVAIEDTKNKNLAGRKTNSVVSMASQEPPNQQIDGLLRLHIYAIHRSLAPTCVTSRSQALFTKWPGVLLLAHNHPGGPTIRSFRETLQDSLPGCWVVWGRNADTPPQSYDSKPTPLPSQCLLPQIK